MARRPRVFRDTYTPGGGGLLSVIVPPHWASQRSATIVLRPIPTEIQPWDIKQWLQNYGNVQSVEFEHGGRTSSIKVRFEPPPSDLGFIRHGVCKIPINDSYSVCRVEFPHLPGETPTLRTPLGNFCPAWAMLRPEKFAFGVMPRPATFMPKREIPRSGSELNFAVDFQQMKFIIGFPLLVAGAIQRYRLSIKFGIVRRISRTTHEGQPALVMTLSDPPFVQLKDEKGIASDTGQRSWRELWRRAIDVKPAGSDSPATPVSMVEENSEVDFGRWTTYWFDLDGPATEAWLRIESHLSDWNLFSVARANFDKVPNRSPELWSLLGEVGPPPNSSDLPSNTALLSLTPIICLPFDVRYQLEVCISRGIFSEYEIGREFLEKLVELSEPNMAGLCRARAALEYAADQGHPIHNPMSLFEDRGAMTYYPTSMHMPSYCALMRKITITPTKVYFSTPTVETTNRIIRRYGTVRDNFIRVQFTDELTEGRLRSSDPHNHEHLIRVFRVFLHGIRMGRWCWKFLAYGNSQLREHQAFFFCEPDDGSITCDAMRQWMGTFDHIQVVAKVAARLGQCFSTTRLLTTISSPSIVKISDVERNKFCFTDGVGKLSPTLAKLISVDWGVTPTPSAFQFRMGGCKGVLVTWPDAKGIEVHVRPSQEKFPAQFNGLEIIRCSQFASATLNRQTIVLLSTLGIPDKVFTDMMAEQVASYEEAMVNEAKAVELLTSFVDENMITNTMASMIMYGFMQTNEPFFRSVLQLWKAWMFKGFREKAKLVVSQGAFVMGCVDETGILRGHFDDNGTEKGMRDKLPQIFLQIPNGKDSGTYQVITGVCLVGRNPSLHPSDLRIVEAVDVPHLRHLRDVVVFPITGDRDIPSMCSGGDLDGDDFFVVWDPRLIPRGPTPKAMSFESPKPIVKKSPVTATDMAGHFVQYIQHDNLPLIAHAHLALADDMPDGAWDPKCLKLAELHSTAVDAVKSGRFAVCDKRLQPFRYPHFMEKPRAKTYHSTKVLGKLYDMVKKETFDNSENYKVPFDNRILRRYRLDNTILKEARKLKTQYDVAMRRVMGQHEIRTEFEVWTGFVMTKPRVGSDYKVQEKVGREAAALKNQFRDLVLKTIAEHGFDKLEFVAAMYRVTWEETQIALHESRQPHVRPDGTVARRRVTARTMPLLSFPWLFHYELGCAALGRDNVLTTLSGRVTARPGRAAKTSEALGVGEDGDEASGMIDLAKMGYTKTDDGQVIHHGEIVQLFRHQDGDDDPVSKSSSGPRRRPFANDVDVRRANVELDYGSESETDAANPAETMSLASESVLKAADDISSLVDLSTTMDDIDNGDGQNESSETVNGGTGFSGHAADMALLDPTIWDLNAFQGDDDKWVEKNGVVTAPAGVSSATAGSIPASTAASTVSTHDGKAHSERASSPNLRSSMPETSTNGTLTSPSKTSAESDENGCLSPVRYIPIVHLRDGCYGYGKPITVAGLWEWRTGDDGQVQDGDYCDDGDGNSGDEVWDEYLRLKSLGHPVNSGQNSQLNGKANHEENQSHMKEEEGSGEDKESRHLSETVADRSSDSDWEGAEFEEDVIEVVEETVLERAARFVAAE